MYLTVLERSMGCVLGQHDESGRKEQAIYYLSKSLPTVNKVKYIFEKPALTGRVARWQMMLTKCYAGTTYPELTYLGQRRMKKAFGQKVRPRGYQVGELVLKRFLPPNTDHRGKWPPNYEGPYVVKRVFL
ncbi:hypothetical protein KIW84_064294 [Lathyrus oleraceus]|uniref:Uncharacterized protein n=1 Tax=Pisum sativum TaxID=3888 RepID=A0A9D4WC51_PEA|nr:hypothetical protein KIW84_064294 [Pisum sativum]